MNKTHTQASAKASRVKGPHSPTLHRDGTVTYWSVYRQTWVRSSSLPAKEYAAQGWGDRDRIMRHLRA